MGRIAFLGAVLAAAMSLNPLTAGGQAQASDLRVEVSGLRNFKGHVVLYLWSVLGNTVVFPDPGKVQIRDERDGDPPCDIPQITVCRRSIDSLQNLTVSYTFKSVPPGDYAVFVFHDENANGILDTGLFKRPLEARGYSEVLPEDVSPLADRIKFEQARFSFADPKTIVIGLRYPPRL
jgi:uncharacterized protein (DUF2141 family)